MAGDAARLDGQWIERIDAHGKHLFYRWANDLTVHVHLGLFGRFLRHRSPAGPPVGQVRMRMEGQRWTVDLSGPTDCRIVSPDEERIVRARLGPDPLRRDADPDRVWERLVRRRTAIGAALLDQSVIAGVGNVYRAEALFLHGIHPERPANTLLRQEFDALWATITELLEHGVRDNRIITMTSADLASAGVTRRALRSKEAVYVYRQDSCRRCAATVQRWELAGRWAYACPRCQSR